MPTLGTHFPDDEAELVEKAAKSAGQKVGPYIADAVRARLRSEGISTPEAEARAVCEDLIASIGAPAVKTLLKQAAMASATT
jgi:hypothetical protein